MQTLFLKDAWYNFFFYRSVEILNKLPDELVFCKKVEEFRLKFKEIILNKILLIKLIRTFYQPFIKFSDLV